MYQSFLAIELLYQTYRLRVTAEEDRLFYEFATSPFYLPRLMFCIVLIPLIS